MQIYAMLSPTLARTWAALGPKSVRPGGVTLFGNYATSHAKNLVLTLLDNRQQMSYLSSTDLA